MKKRSDLALRLMIRCAVLAALILSISTGILKVNTAQAQPLQLQSIYNAPIQDFQLITDFDGWVIVGDDLFWTGDGGITWKDITPDFVRGELHTAFFLNDLNGWLVYSYIESVVNYAVATTEDGGHTWNSNSVVKLGITDEDAFSSAIQVSFFDQKNGWIVAKRISSSNFNIGTIYKTKDGGTTWEKIALPLGEPVNFINHNLGWTTGGVIGDDFYRTIDGGRNWQVYQPDKAQASQRFKYALPVFGDGQVGLLPVLIETNAGTLIRFYSSTDGGQNWNQGPAKMISDHVGISVPLSVVDNTGFVALPNQLLVYDVAGGRFNSYSISLNNVNEIQMVSLETGWAKQSSLDCGSKGDTNMCTAIETIYLTTDGGKSWLPVNLPAVDSSAKNIEPFSDRLQTEMLAVPLGEQTSIFVGQGVDICEIPAEALLQTWKSNGPYNVINLYIGGISRACPNARLNASFLQTLQGQGWKFIPTWVGKQASCSIFINKMSSNASTAYNQGKDEAVQALSDAEILGLTDATKSGTVIYYDLEGFDTTDTQCLNAAKAFINGWSEVIQANGSLAGVYGSTCASGLSHFNEIANPPDVLWPAAWTYSSYSSAAGIWNLNCLSNDLWPDHQRIRQYSGSHNETWGGFTFNIDSNVIDGVVADLFNSSGISGPKLLNPSFQEVQLSPWAFLADETACNWSLVNDFSAAYHDSQYLAANENGNNPNCSGFYQDVNFTPLAGDTYQFAIWMQAAPSTNPRTATISLGTLGGAAGTEETAAAQYTNINTSWTCIETSLNVQNDGHTTLRAEIRLESDDSDDYYFDYAQLSRSTNPLCPQPLPPSNVSASDGIFENKIQISWDQAPGAIYYEVYRAASLTDVKSLLASPAATTWDDTNVPGEQDHYYWVKSCFTYGCSNFSGGDAGHLKLIPGQASLVYPGGAITNQSPTFLWDEAINTSEYRLVVTGETGDVIDQWYLSGSACSAGSCWAASPITLGYGTYTWKIQTKNRDGLGPWSLPMNFTVSPPVCYALTLSHSGVGGDPAASPLNSEGCNTGEYLAGESITLTGSPASGWGVKDWVGTDNDASTATTNTVTMPAGAHSASVNYGRVVIAYPGFESAIPNRWGQGKNLEITDTMDCTIAHSGTCSYTMTGSGINKVIYAYYGTTGSAGDTVDFSVWRKAAGYTGSGPIIGRVVFIHSAGGTKDFYDLDLTSGDVTQWEQLSQSVAATADYRMVTISLLYGDSGGQVWFDDISTVLNGTTELIVYPGFESAIPNRWGQGKNLEITDTMDCTIAHSGTCSYTMTGSGINKVIYAYYGYNGLAGDTVDFSVWRKAAGYTGGGPIIGRVVFIHSAGGTKDFYDLDLTGGDVTQWEQLSQSVVATADYRMVTISLLYGDSGGQVWFDDIRVILFQP